MRSTLFIVMLGVFYSCNPQEEYYPSLDSIAGADQFCSEAKDLNSCQSLADICQPAFDGSENELGEPTFAGCVANPEIWDDEEVAGGQEDPDQTVPEETTPPTIEEAIDAKCNLSEKYLLTEVTTRKDKVVSKKSKVKVCHNLNNPHTIIISCNALKAHMAHKHAGDYIGACEN